MNDGNATSSGERSEKKPKENLQTIKWTVPVSKVAAVVAVVARDKLLSICTILFTQV